MSLYNMLFGRNAQTDLLLAVIGFKACDVERLRDVHVDDDGRTIAVYTRTGGGNREGYPQVALYRSPLFARTEDDDFDSTYATFYFNVPPEFVEDVKGLADPLANGLRREFCEHLAKTLRREPTEADKATAAYDAESETLRRTRHFMANGHTFVPMDDAAMRVALEIAEKNAGELRTAWGIMPLALNVITNERPYAGAKDEKLRLHINRAEIKYDYGWKIDADYWEHCRDIFTAEFPVTMAKIVEAVTRHVNRNAA